MGIISWIIFGLIVGLIVSLIKGSQGGMLMNIVIGIIGAVVGGWLGTLLNIGDVTGFNIKSILLSVVGALIVLALVNMFTRKR